MTQTPKLLQWETLEFEPQDISRSFYMWIGIFLLLTILYALATNSPIMAITFILIGIMGFVTLEQDPKMIRCAITTEGVILDKELYVFENIQSFWIVYEGHEKYISLQTTGKLTAFVHVPLGNENPNEARTILLKYVPEEKHEPTLIDTIGKLLHIR
ncbi:MAG: hypothetical protein PHT88_03595 [Candidatus Moranbacteria bacterium]|nr:hypothetical protein [Candidatus Moranbacteria bacterium]